MLIAQVLVVHASNNVDALCWFLVDAHCRVDVPKASFVTFINSTLTSDSSIVFIFAVKLGSRLSTKSSVY